MWNPVPNPLGLDDETLLDEWNNLSADCQSALTEAMPGTGGQNADREDMNRVKALNRAINDEGIFLAATPGTDLDWTMLAAIGIRESGFVDKNQANGLGVGVFQIDLGQNPSVTAGQASNTQWSADWMGTYLMRAESAFSGLQGVSADTMQWMLAASWNTGIQGQINRYNSGQSPDWQTAPMGNGQYRNDYGSNVLGLMHCFD